MRPGTLALSVIDQLVEKAGHTHLVVANGGSAGIKDRAGDDVDIALGPLRIAARVFFDTGPGAAVLLDGLGHHIGQREALGHGLCGRHVASGSHVAA
ncbi:hypothetical protein SDC9_154918 [bioreactor metagenome]|uniref:Uncharacterized protein n=1 Tax=bioreactor metagenome TaxID=1076179 RepID=A0A645F0C7_9ZZZZ